MQVVKCQSNLAAIEGCEVLSQLAAAVQMVKELATTAVVQNKMEPGLRLERVVQLDDKGMRHICQHSALGHGVLDLRKTQMIVTQSRINTRF